MDTIGVLVNQFIQPALVHHQLVLGSQNQLLDAVATAVLNNHAQNMAYQEWSHSLFACISDNQRNSLVSQKYFTASLNSLCSSLPGYIKNQLCKFNEHQAAQRDQIEAFLLNHCQDFETMVSELNQFREHVNSQLKLIGAHVDTWGYHLQQQYGLDKAALGDTLYQVQNYVDDRVASIEVTLPAPPVETPSDFETKVWEAITKLKATTQRQASVQNPPPVEPMPDPCIASLTDQVATLRGEIKYLRQRLSNSEDLSSESEDEEEGEVVNTHAHVNHGSCPGLEGQPWIHCVCALYQLAKVTNDVADRQEALEREVQNLSCFTKILNGQVAPLVAQITSLATRLNGIAGTLAVQQIKIDKFGPAAATVQDISGQNSFTLDTLEESL